MKRFLGILVLGLLLSSNAYARIIKLKCNPIGFGELVNNQISTDFFKIRLDTKLKKLSYYSKFEYVNNVYRGDDSTTTYFQVLSVDDQYVVFKNPNYEGPEPSTFRLDYINFIEVVIEPTYSQGWNLRCVHEKDSEIAEKPKKKKPKQTPQEIERLKKLEAQIYGCWSIPLGLPLDEDLVVKIKLELNQDGTILRSEISDHGKNRLNYEAGQGFYSVLVESLLRAIRLCQPLIVPTTGYERWKDLQLNFDAREMFEG